MTYCQSARQWLCWWDHCSQRVILACSPWRRICGQTVESDTCSHASALRKHEKWHRAFHHYEVSVVPWRHHVVCPLPGFPALFSSSLPLAYHCCSFTPRASWDFPKWKATLTHIDHTTTFEIRKLFVWHSTF